jgi:hypothetical protein
MMPWAVLGLGILFLIVTYIILQGTRAALAWREAAAKGDVKVIRDIVEDCIKGWSGQKRPKPVAPETWRGIQSMQLVDVDPGYVRVSVIAESEYRMENGAWVEIRNPLHEGFAITAKAADMLFYELPHYRPERLQVDVYAQYRSEDGATRRECILSTYTDREVARTIDWEEWTAEEVVRALGGLYRLSDTGRPLPIEPIRVPKAEPAPEGTVAEAHP